ncbi:MAG: hypothetical protein HY696_00520 [Deltaproteobacteria bacterium]|nr:hypothetical protein [Deltaproteobacteria bacterium]
MPRSAALTLRGIANQVLGKRATAAHGTECASARRGSVELRTAGQWLRSLTAPLSYARQVATGRLGLAGGVVLGATGCTPGEVIGGVTAVVMLLGVGVVLGLQRWPRLSPGLFAAPSVLTAGGCRANAGAVVIQGAPARGSGAVPRLTTDGMYDAIARLDPAQYVVVYSITDATASPWYRIRYGDTADSLFHAERGILIPSPQNSYWTPWTEVHWINFCRALVAGRVPGRDCGVHYWEGLGDNPVTWPRPCFKVEQLPNNPARDAYLAALTSMQHVSETIAASGGLWPADDTTNGAI